MPMYINEETGLPEYRYEFDSPEISAEDFLAAQRNRDDPNKPQPGQPGYDEEEDDDETQAEENEEAVKRDTDEKARRREQERRDPTTGIPE